MAVLLKTQIVRTSDPGDGKLSASEGEPTFHKPVIRCMGPLPALVAASGRETGLDAYLDKGLVGARMTATPVLDDGYRLTVSTVTTRPVRSRDVFKDAYRGAHTEKLGSVTVDANGWARLWLPNLKGECQGLQMLVHVVPAPSATPLPLAKPGVTSHGIPPATASQRRGVPVASGLQAP